MKLVFGGGDKGLRFRLPGSTSSLILANVHNLFDLRRLHVHRQTRS